jgi:hypothetical protein
MLEKNRLGGEKRTNRYMVLLWYYVFWWEDKSIQIKWLTTETLRTLLLDIDIDIDIPQPSIYSPRRTHNPVN